MIFQRPYGVATVTANHVRIPIIKRDVADFAVSADWTPAAGDVRISKDGGVWANITTLPTASSAGGNGSSAVWVFQFSATELAARQIMVMISDATTKAIEDQCFVIETFPSIVSGTVGSGTNNTTTISISGGLGAISPAVTATDQYKGRTLIFRCDTTTAALQGQAVLINGNSSTAITLAAANALTNAAQNGDTFDIY